MAVLNLNLADYDPVDLDLALIPSGDYEVLIVDSRLKQNLALQGLLPQAEVSSRGQSMAVYHPGSLSQTSLLAAEFEFVVLGPVCKGAKLQDSFTLSEEASMRRMKAMVVAARCANPDFIRNSEELHGLRCRVRVERRGDFRCSGCKSVISGYMRSGTRIPLCEVAPGASLFAAEPSSGSHLIAERVETAGLQSCDRSYPWEDSWKLDGDGEHEC